MTCGHCVVSVEADFSDRPMTRLPLEHQRFIEMFVLAGGSLKEIAAQAGVSYPTVRNRLDKVIEQLQAEMAAEAQSEAKRKGGKSKASGKSSSKEAAEILKRI